VKNCGPLCFIKEMNSMARKLELHNTHFSNQHGLFDKNNFSSAQDLAKLSFFSLQNN
jgi:D-alanyl-D-alanine carboxypeptidase